MRILRPLVLALVAMLTLAVPVSASPFTTTVTNFDAQGHPPGGGGRPLVPADRRGLRAGKGGGDRIHRVHRVRRGGCGTAGDSWRQATGTPVWGTPYGPYTDEKGQPVDEDAIRAALATATR